MGNKPHRVKKIQQKALKHLPEEKLLKNYYEENKKTTQNLDLHPFNMNLAIETLSQFKKNATHLYLTHKPHSSKRTTPGDVAKQVPRIMNSKTFEDKNKKKWQKGGLQRSTDHARKHFKDTWKKAG